MQHVVALRSERGVVVGAQVSYRDLAGFGRRFIDVGPAELTAEVVYQVGALRAFAEAVGVRVAYVKRHGALYNAVITTRGRLPLSSRPRGCSATTSSRSGCGIGLAASCRGRPRRAGRTVLVTLDPRVTTTAVAAPLRSAAGTLGRPTGGATSRAHEISVVEVAFAGFTYLAGARSRARSGR